MAQPSKHLNRGAVSFDDQRLLNRTRAQPIDIFLGKSEMVAEFACCAPRPLQSTLALGASSHVPLASRHTRLLSESSLFSLAVPYGGLARKISDQDYQGDT